MFEYLQKTIIIIEIECQNGEESRGDGYNTKYC